MPASVSAGVAQSVEQHIRNVRVVGSNPITGSIKSKACSDAGFFIFAGATPGLRWNEKGLGPVLTAPRPRHGGPRRLTSLSRNGVRARSEPPAIGRPPECPPCRVPADAPIMVASQGVAMASLDPEYVSDMIPIGSVQDGFPVAMVFSDVWPHRFTTEPLYFWRNRRVVLDFMGISVLFCVSLGQFSQDDRPRRTHCRQ